MASTNDVLERVVSAVTSLASRTTTAERNQAKRHGEIMGALLEIVADPTRVDPPRSKPRSNGHASGLLVESENPQREGEEKSQVISVPGIMEVRIPRKTWDSIWRNAKAGIPWLLGSLAGWVIHLLQVHK